MESSDKIYQRRRPTASARKSALEQYVAAHKEKDDAHKDAGNNSCDAQENSGNDNYDARENNQEENVEEYEVLKGPFPGGPSDPSVLCSLKTHVAASIWNGNERGVLKCHCLTSRYLKWICDSSTEPWRSLTKKSGLLRVREMSYKGPNHNLISAFVERWHPETNSFHFPFGEMTITLEDVYCLTGLNITGKPVQLVGEDDAIGHSIVCRLLGVSAEEANNAISDRGCSVKLNWLLTKFAKDTSTSDSTVALYAARAYLLYTLGCTIFADKSGDKVYTNYLRLFEDPDKFGEYAWGAATLAFLYRQLGLTSRVGVKQISGYLTLLEAWIYEHFPSIYRATANAEYRASQPLALKWTQQKHAACSVHYVKAYRAQLDSLKAVDVVWDPYELVRDGGERTEVHFMKVV